MGDQQAREAGLRQSLGEKSEVPGVLVAVARARPARPTPRPLRATLTSPIEAPDREPAGGEVDYRLEVFFDALGKAADQHAFGPRPVSRQVAPAQPRSIRSAQTSPDETGRFENAGGKRRDP